MTMDMIYLSEVVMCSAATKSIKIFIAQPPSVSCQRALLSRPHMAIEKILDPRTNTRHNFMKEVPS